MVIKSKQPSQVLIVHSDRGSQYCSNDYNQIIKQHKLKGSMFKRSNCFDNALIESFWGTLKNQQVYQQDYKTRFESISGITKYIELDYKE